MGRMANLSVLGLYTWDNDLFSLLHVPDALDRNTLISNILMETAELEVLFPNPEVMKDLIGVWSLKQLDVWNRLYLTTQYEYDPIANYDRTETGTRKGNGTDTHSGTDKQTDTSALSGTDSISNEGKGESYKAGFDSVASGTNDGLVKERREETEGSATTTYGKKDDRTGQTEYGHKIDSNKNEEYSLHAHGNIGVTTTQQLIKEQREVDKFNLYDIIIKEFQERFCVMVY